MQEEIKQRGAGVEEKYVSKLKRSKSRFCFFSNLWCSHTPAIIHEELTKFGYRSENKVEKIKNLAIFWRPARTYCLNMATSENLFFTIWQLWGIFCMSHNGFLKFHFIFSTSDKNSLKDEMLIQILNLLDYYLALVCFHFLQTLNSQVWSIGIEISGLVFNFQNSHIDLFRKSKCCTNL